MLRIPSGSVSVVIGRPGITAKAFRQFESTIGLGSNTAAEADLHSTLFLARRGEVSGLEQAKRGLDLREQPFDFLAFVRPGSLSSRSRSACLRACSSATVDIASPPRSTYKRRGAWAIGLPVPALRYLESRSGGALAGQADVSWPSNLPVVLLTKWSAMQAGHRTDT